MVAGTTVYWELRNFGNSNFYTEFADDLSTPRTGSGQVQTVGNNVELDFNITVENDMTSSEGSEYFKIVVWDDASNYATGPNFDGAVSGALATKDITISDLNPQWQITTATNNQVEGGAGILNFNILTRYVMVGQTYTWTAVPHGSNPAAAADFVGGVFPSGSGTVGAFNNTLTVSGFFTTELVADNTTEGVEQYSIELSDQNGNVVATKVINITDNSQTPAGEVYWFHLGGGGYPYIQDLINGTPQYLSDNSTSTSTPVFEAIFADALANPSSYETVNSQSGLQSGDQFAFGTSVAQNLYWILIPDSLGVPDLTQNARLADTANNINDVAAAKLAMNVNGNPYTLYQVNILPATGTLTIQYNV